MKREITQMKRRTVSSTAYAIFLAILVVIALRLSTINTFGAQPTQRTFSAIGRRYPEWFIIWGFVTGVALVLNIKHLAARVNFKSNKLNRLLTMAFIFGIINVFVNPPYGFGNVIHIWAALISSFTFFMTMAVMFFVASRKYNTKVGYIYFAIMMVSLAAYGIGYLVFGGLVAIMQIQMFWVAGTCLLGMNFFHKFGNEDIIAEAISTNEVTAGTLNELSNN